MYDHVLVPIAYHEGRDAEAAIEIARAIAAPEARITLIHVMDEIPSYAITYLPEGFRSESRKAIEADLQSRAEGLDTVATAVIEGHPGRAITDFAAKHNVDCIVIASHRPGVQDLFLGSTAARVVRHANCAVHVLR